MTAKMSRDGPVMSTKMLGVPTFNEAKLATNVMVSMNLMECELIIDFFGKKKLF